MNRKERRAARNPSAALPKEAKIAQMLAVACEHHQAGQLPKAEQLYRQILALDPKHVVGLRLLGGLSHQVGHHEAAVELLGQAISLEGRNHAAHYNLGLALKALGRLPEAVAHYSQAIKLQPGFAEAYFELGSTLANQGELSEAATQLRQASALRPNYAEAHNNLGSVLQRQGNFEEAIGEYQRAIALKPHFTEALKNAANSLLVLGAAPAALRVVAQALAFDQSDIFKVLFIQCVKQMSGHPDLGLVRDFLWQALSEPWARPIELMGACTDVLKLDPVTGPCIARAARAWPSRLLSQELFADSSIAAFAENRQVNSLLESNYVCDVNFERFLTTIRLILLKEAEEASVSNIVAESLLSFYCALARQCFINEYIFAHTNEELEQAQALRQSLASALQAGSHYPALWVVAVAAYFPLHDLPGAEILLGRRWPAAMTALLEQQVREPQEERADRASIPVLTAIDDDVSIAVKGQYEEHPYPRWVKLRLGDRTLGLQTRPRSVYHDAEFASLNKDSVDVLVAGCGTGQHPIEVASKYKDAQVLAIDLSLASLSYARRQTRALGLNNIRYAQADITKLQSIGQSFDVIEAIGVLHHLADPLAGWRTLLSLLRPGGVMRIGLYSELARTNIVSAQKFAVERGYRSTADDIRRCRQELIDLSTTDIELRSIITLGDFFTTSMCRDLLFHVQEHRMTIPQIKAFLAENDLKFHGFEIDQSTQGRYARRFPDDVGVTDLDHWHLYETENPLTFIELYIIWAQRDG